MKRILALMLSVVMMLFLTACGEKGNITNSGDNVNQTQNSGAENNLTEIVGDNGEKFTADLSNVGTVKEGAEAISSTKFELAGTSYTFPINMSEMFNNGWALSKGYEYETEFEANNSTNLVSYYLVHESGMQISLNQITNDSSESKDIKECSLTGFSIKKYDLAGDSDFVIPGGIVPKSTAANVISVFGNPNDAGEFSQDSYNLDEQLTYVQHNSSNISYSFSFSEDGSLYGVNIEHED